MDPQATDELAATRRWPPHRQVVAAIGWSSFLAASAGTMLLFAALDPEVIISGLDTGEPGAQPWWLTRTGIYSIGFFLLWMVGALAGVLTAVLSPPTSPNGGRP